MDKLRIMSVFGTRPEAIKMCPLVKELASRPEIESLCCVTAQHRQMLDSVLEVFDVKPDWDLDIMTPRQTLSTITSKCLTGMDEAIDTLKPDMILVHGDTSTTFAGALSAFYHQVKVGHVEAGLRTYDKYSPPFPEEMNRKLVSSIADLYFCPTVNNKNNLLKEGITEGLFVTGNTVIDALETTVRADYTFSTDELNHLPYGGEEDHPRHLPPPGELWRTHEADHAGSAADCGGKPGGGAGVPCSSQPGRAGSGGQISPGRAQSASHRSAAGGRDAQPDGSLLSGHDGFRRFAGGSACAGQARAGDAPGDGAA